MASAAPRLRRKPASALDAALATILALPRPALVRLTTRLIDRMDELDPDCDLEPEQDRCDAGEDHIIAGPVSYQERGHPAWVRSMIGSDDDAEQSEQAP